MVRRRPCRRSVLASETTGRFLPAVIAGLFALAVAQPTRATVHGFCGASATTSTCTDDGTITPTTQNPLLEFGFTRSPDSNSGLTTPTFELVALVPDTAARAGSQTLEYLGTGTSVTASTTLTRVGGGFHQQHARRFLGPDGRWRPGQPNQRVPGG
jgi:hypothetical protein